MEAMRAYDATPRLAELAGLPTVDQVGLLSITVSGTPSDVVVTAKDAFGNTATGYTGTVHLSSSDATATLQAGGNIGMATPNVQAMQEVAIRRTACSSVFRTSPL